MLSINMRVFKTVLLLSALFSSVLCLPVPDDSTEASSPGGLRPTTHSSSDIYDQRQNGTENYRIHLDGLVFVFAPAEALLGSAGVPTLSLDNLAKPKPETEPPKPIAAPKSAHRSLVRMSQFLMPLLRRIRQE